MKSKTERILTVMNVLAWIVFVGAMIDAGGDLTSWGISFWHPLAAKDLFNHLDLYALREFSVFHYSLAVLFSVAAMIMIGYTAYLVIKVLSKIKLSNPFTQEIAQRMERISYFLLATWILVMLKNLHTYWLQQQVPGVKVEYISGDFIFTAGVVFVFAQIFKKGVELQTEHELTV